MDYSFTSKCLGHKRLWVVQYPGWLVQAMETWYTLSVTALWV